MQTLYSIWDKLRGVGAFYVCVIGVYGYIKYRFGRNQTKVWVSIRSVRCRYKVSIMSENNRWEDDDIWKWERFVGLWM